MEIFKAKNIMTTDVAYVKRETPIYDAIGILSFLDNVTAAALSMAVMSGGGVKHVKTIPLVSWEEGIKAMKKAKKATYKPPESNPMIDRG